MEALRASCLVVASWIAGAAIAAPPQLDASLPVQLEANSSDVDYKNNKLLFRAVRISQGALSVEADQATATGLDFNDSRWLFSGHVRITTQDGFLTSDEARIVFTANLLSAADIVGSPARFQQQRATGIASGHALHIDYRPATTTVRLAGEAFLTDGKNDITGDTLLYNLHDQQVLANPDEQGTQRVRITINPKRPDPKPNP
jgi:lipopolysaccharide transport protein LptA